MNATERRPLKDLLRERRRELGLSQEQAAARCGLSQPVYARYELGRRPDDDMLDGIVAFLGLSRADVILARSAEYVGGDTKVDELERRIGELERVIRSLTLPPSPGSE